MALLLAALLIVCGIWSNIVIGQNCVDESSFTEQVVYLGHSYTLQCPLQTQSLPQTLLTWQKNCRQLQNQEGKAFLRFSSITLEDQGNYTCMQQGNNTPSFTGHLVVKESQCAKAPDFNQNGNPTTLWRNAGSIVNLNCTALLFWDPLDGQCDSSLQWSKDGQPLINHTLYTHNTTSWSPDAGQLIVSSLLKFTIKEAEDFGLYSCTVRNVSSDFSVRNLNGPNHTAAVTAAIFLLLLLGIAAVVYSRCHLNIKLWYKNSYGDYELSDGKLYDAYISYVNNDNDRKFVNFILKPHLENKNGYKLHLNDNDILPNTGIEPPSIFYTTSRMAGANLQRSLSGRFVYTMNMSAVNSRAMPWNAPTALLVQSEKQSKPSAELLMNISRSRRLIVLLSHPYLEQDWCANNFRQGLLHLLELCQQPILITLEGQLKRMSPDIKQQLNENQHRLTILTWRHNSVTPSSSFWKELALAMPRRVIFHKESPGDPQTVLQDDKDPMLTLDPDYLDCRTNPEPAGDLGLRLPMHRALACKAPVLPAGPVEAAQSKAFDIDISDLGSRNYEARSDFYCLVTEDI